jgi:hypothetical protein
MCTKFDIFLSYSKKDKERVKTIVEKLQARDWSVWWDRQIPPGKTFDGVIQEALDASRCVVVICSKTSIDSQWVRTEANEAMKEKRLVPARIDELEWQFTKKINTIEGYRKYTAEKIKELERIANEERIRREKEETLGERD